MATETWVINEEPDLDGFEQDTEISFISNNTTYEIFRIIHNLGLNQYM